MFIIRKSFEFSASHKLEHLPKDHPCTRVHGHNYVVTVELRTKRKRDLTEPGFVQDYRELATMKAFIDNMLDHKHLNDVLDINPSAELIAEYLFHTWKEQYPKLWAVEVSETPKTIARYDCS